MQRELERRRPAERARHPNHPGRLRLSVVRRAAILAALVACASLATAQPLDPGEPAAAIYARYASRAAHVETIGTLHDGSREVAAGSGLLVADGYVLTSNHVVPREANFRSVRVNVRFGSRSADPLAVKTVHRDPGRDLALLELAALTGEGRAACPMLAATRSELVPTGLRLFALGYLNRPGFAGGRGV